MNSLHDQIVGAIKTIKDPELPINIYDLGLIRKLDINGGIVRITHGFAFILSLRVFCFLNLLEYLVNNIWIAHISFNIVCSFQ